MRYANVAAGRTAFQCRFHDRLSLREGCVRAAEQRWRSDALPIDGLCGGDQPIETWSDFERQPLEAFLGDIAVAIVVHGERVPAVSTIVNG